MIAAVGVDAREIEKLLARLPPERDDTLKPGDTFAGFQVLALLGRGGMGEVYLAREDFTDRMVALKVLPIRREASQDARDRMRREAAAGVRLNHPNIVRVYGGGLVDGKVYISMEWLRDGRTLRDIISDGKVAVESAVAWAAQIADALDAMHRITVWHRDLKPENVIVVPGGAVHVIDFGLARVRTENLKTTRRPDMGTPHYMAPEQIDERLGEADGRVDIYALGLILGEMLVGHHMLESDTRRFNKQEIAMRQLMIEPPSLRQMRPTLPAALSILVDRMLAKRPEERPRPSEIALELVAIGEAVRAVKSSNSPGSLAHARTELHMEAPPPQAAPAQAAAPQGVPPSHGARGTVRMMEAPPGPPPGLAAGPATMVVPATERSPGLAQFEPDAAAVLDTVARSQRGAAMQTGPHTVPEIPVAPSYTTDERFGATSTHGPAAPQRSTFAAALTGVLVGLGVLAVAGAGFGVYTQVIAPRTNAGPAAQPPTATAAAETESAAPVATPTPVPTALPGASASASASGSAGPPGAAPNVQPPQTPAAF